MGRFWVPLCMPSTLEVFSRSQSPGTFTLICGFHEERFDDHRDEMSRRRITCSTVVRSQYFGRSLSHYLHALLQKSGCATSTPSLTFVPEATPAHLRIPWILRAGDIWGPDFVRGVRAGKKGAGSRTVGAAREVIYPGFRLRGWISTIGRIVVPK